ncbi:MAG TPA: DUF1007 family protein [Rhodospirillaceae bacterium]|nr:DUF1007 family protein [Rhodospirillaceae bacterium]
MADPAWRLVKFWLPLMALLLWQGPVQAHPHVWVDMVVTALFSEGKVNALQEDWWFDEDFTATVLGDIRKLKGVAAARPQPLTDAEIDRLKKQAFANLANYAYFTHVWRDAQPVAIGKEVTSFAAHMEGGRLSYRFTVTLAEPIDPRQHRLRIGIWDDSYYVDVGPAKGGAAALEGDGAEGCQAKLVDDKDHPLYFGAVIPKVIAVSCAKG